MIILRNIFTAILVLLLIPSAAFAHGVNITYQNNTVTEITARYDTGKPLSDAQVTVYAPGNPSIPWATGQTDKDGRYVLTPDPSRPGTWNVRVRQAGHGGMVNIVLENGQAIAATAGYSTTQVVLMTACVLWGLIGTALFFSRRKG